MGISPSTAGMAKWNEKFRLQKTHSSFFLLFSSCLLCFSYYAKNGTTIIIIKSEKPILWPTCKTNRPRATRPTLENTREFLYHNFTFHYCMSRAIIAIAWKRKCWSFSKSPTRLHWILRETRKKRNKLSIHKKKPTCICNVVLIRVILCWGEIPSRQQRRSMHIFSI